jgi:hypothetical protein
MTELKSELLFNMHAKLEPAIDVGATPEGHRLIIHVTGGHFEGPGIKGTVVGGSGADWARIRPDGSFALDVRITLKTDDGAFIYVTYGGRLVAPDQTTLARALDFYKPDDPASGDEVYFRTNPLFETSSDKYAWLNNVVAIGKGRTGDGGVTYSVYAIK